MMIDWPNTSLIHAFKEALSGMSFALGVSGGQLWRERQIGLFLLDAKVAERWSPSVFAAKALSALCVPEGNAFDKVIVMAVIDVLDRFHPSPPTDNLQRARRARDCLLAVTSGADEAHYAQWIKSHFPDL